MQAKSDTDLDQSDKIPSSTLSIVILDYQGSQKAGVLGMFDLLSAANRLHQDMSGKVSLAISISSESDGFVIPDSPVQVAILPPSLAQEPPDTIPDELRDWLLKAHGHGTILCSVCVGAFLLAQLGLLDDRPATTHWALAQVFADSFPDVRVDSNKLVIDDGDVISAGGLMAWVDLCLHLIGRFLGPTTLLETARLFLVDPGGREQRFYRVFSPQLSHGDDAILRTQRWLQGRIGQPTSVAMMAKYAALGHRTFMRRFQRATGLKTTEYLQHLAIGKARSLLELSTMSQQEVAWEVGYEDSSAFRRVFVKLMGLSPSEYRRRFVCVQS